LPRSMVAYWSSKMDNHREAQRAGKPTHSAVFIAAGLAILVALAMVGAAL